MTLGFLFFSIFISAFALVLSVGFIQSLKGRRKKDRHQTRISDLEKVKKIAYINFENSIYNAKTYFEKAVKIKKDLGEGIGSTEIWGDQETSKYTTLNIDLNKEYDKIRTEIENASGYIESVIKAKDEIKKIKLFELADETNKFLGKYKDIAVSALKNQDKLGRTIATIHSQKNITNRDYDNIITNIEKIENKIKEIDKGIETYEKDEIEIISDSNPNIRELSLEKRLLENEMEYNKELLHLENNKKEGLKDIIESLNQEFYKSSGIL